MPIIKKHMRSARNGAGRVCWSRSRPEEPTLTPGVMHGSTKVATRTLSFSIVSLPGWVYFEASPKWLWTEYWGSILSLLLGVAGFAYALLFLGFWSIGRMSALSDRFAESRVNVIPFRRG